MATLLALRKQFGVWGDGNPANPLRPVQKEYRLCLDKGSASGSGRIYSFPKGVPDGGVRSISKILGPLGAIH